MANRLLQVSGHISNTHSRGLLTGDVAIITGELFIPTTISTVCLCFWAGAGQVCLCPLLAGKGLF